MYICSLKHRDHEIRNAWLGPSFPLDLSTLPVKSEEVPLQYPSLRKSQSQLIALLDKKNLTTPSHQSWAIRLRRQASRLRNAGSSGLELSTSSSTKRRPRRLRVIECAMCGYSVNSCFLYSCSLIHSFRVSISR